MADDKPKIPTKNYHLWQIGLLVILSGMTLYAAFIRPSSSTVVREGGRIINVSNADTNRFPLLGIGCMRVKLDMYWQKSPQPPQETKK